VLVPLGEYSLVQTNLFVLVQTHFLVQVALGEHSLVQTNLFVLVLVQTHFYLQVVPVQTHFFVSLVLLLYSPTAQYVILPSQYIQ